MALVDLGPTLERAARAALEPWNVELLVVSEPSPGATAPRSNQAARALAQKHEAAAVVWISEYQRGYALWIYDLASDHTVARRLTSAPPFDGPTAAALALTVKTLLRHSATAPARERYGAAAPSDELPSPREPSAAEYVPPSAPPLAPSSSSPSDTKPAAPAREAAAVPQPPATRAALKDSPSTVDRARPLPRRGASEANAATRVKVAREPTATNIEADSKLSALELEANGGLRLLFLGPRTYSPRFGAAITWWPSAKPAGVMLRGASGPAMQLDHTLFRGSLLISSASLSGRLRQDVTRQLRIVAALGAAADLTRLTGSTTGPLGEAVARTKVIPSLALELTSYWLLRSWLRLGVRVAGAWLPITQHYDVAGVSIAKVANFSLESGLLLALGFPPSD